MAAQSVESVTLPPPDGVVDEDFAVIRSVRELADGRTLLTESGTRLLAVANWETGEVSTIGRRGEGPREYRTPGELHSLPDDTVLMLDGSATGMFYLLHGGTIVERVPYQEGRPIRTTHLVGTVDDGHVAETRSHVLDESVGAMAFLAPDSLVVVRARRSSLEEDTLAVVRGPGLLGLCAGAPPQKVGGCSPVYPEEHALLFPDGWLAVARAEPYRVDWRAPDGRWVHGRPLPFMPRRLDASERCAAVQGWAFYGLRAECESEELAGIEWPEELPPVPPSASAAKVRRGMSAPRTPVLFATPRGRLLIRRTPSLDRLETRYDIVDREGRLVGTLSLPLNEAVVGFGRSHVYVVETDPLDLQKLRRHPWP